MDPSLWDHARLEPLLAFIQKAAQEKRFKPDTLIPFQIRPCRRITMLAKARYLESLLQTAG